MKGLNWGKIFKKPSQHCTSGAAWTFFLLTGQDYKRIASNDMVAIGGDARDKKSKIQALKRDLLKKEGVYWGRVCNGNKAGNSPANNPEGCYHSFVLTIGDNGVTNYQTMQAAFSLNSKFGIKTYTKTNLQKRLL